MATTAAATTTSCGHTGPGSRGASTRSSGCGGPGPGSTPTSAHWRPQWSGSRVWWCRGGGGRVRLRQAAAALGQTKTEKALGWAGQGGTSGRAGPRLAGCAVTAWCWPLVAAGAPQKNNSQSARPATARTDRRTCCQALVTFPVITAPLQTYGAQNLSVLKSKVYMLERKNICCSILPVYSSTLQSTQ